jgi:hypothetical protein
VLKLGGLLAADFPRLRPNTTYPATAVASTPDGQEMLANWELWPELPPGMEAEERTEALSGYISQTTARSATVRTPRKPGAYRLLLTLHNRYGGIATANIPFFCGTESQMKANATQGSGLLQ